MIFGNCQASHIAHVLNHVPSLADRFEFMLVMDHAPPGESAPEISQEAAAETPLVWEQYDERDRVPGREELRAAISSSARTIKYPPLGIMGLWPFAWAEPRSVSEPDFPWGRYPWGDRIAQQVVKEGVSREHAFERYMDLSSKAMPDVEALIARDRFLAELRDAKCDVKISEFIFDRVRTDHMFWTWGHTAGSLNLELMSRLLDASRDVLGELPTGFESDLQQASARFPAIGEEQVPVHPEVIERLDLTFCNRDTRWKWFSQRWTFEEYITHYIEYDRNWPRYSAEPELQSPE